MNEQSTIQADLIDPTAGCEMSRRDQEPLPLAELRSIAATLLRGERNGHTLQPTALVNEAFVRLIGKDWEELANKDPRRFIALCATCMRHVLVDHARGRRAVRRGRNNQRMPFNDALALCDQAPELVVELDDLLTVMRTNDELTEPARKAEIATLRIFGNLSESEIAQTIGCSGPTVRREWRQAKAWLAEQLSLDR